MKKCLDCGQYCQSLNASFQAQSPNANKNKQFQTPSTFKSMPQLMHQLQTPPSQHYKKNPSNLQKTKKSLRRHENSFRKYEKKTNNQYFQIQADPYMLTHYLPKAISTQQLKNQNLQHQFSLSNSKQLNNLQMYNKASKKLNRHPTIRFNFTNSHIKDMKSQNYIATNQFKPLKQVIAEKREKVSLKQSNQSRQHQKANDDSLINSKMCQIPKSTKSTLKNNELNINLHNSDNYNNRILNKSIRSALNLQQLECVRAESIGIESQNFSQVIDRNNFDIKRCSNKTSLANRSKSKTHSKNLGIFLIQQQKLQDNMLKIEIKSNY